MSEQVIVIKKSQLISFAAALVLFASIPAAYFYGVKSGREPEPPHECNVALCGPGCFCGPGRPACAPARPPRRDGTLSPSGQVGEQR